MMERDVVTVKEAAEILGTTKEKVARLVKQGVLTSRPSTLDARHRLIPRAEVERILQAEGYTLPVTRETDGPLAGPRSRPRTAGMYSGPLKVHSDEVEEYLRETWRVP